MNEFDQNFDRSPAPEHQASDADARIASALASRIVAILASRSEDDRKRLYAGPIPGRRLSGPDNDVATIDLDYVLRAILYSRRGAGSISRVVLRSASADSWLIEVYPASGARPFVNKIAPEVWGASWVPRWFWPKGRSAGWDMQRAGEITFDIAGKRWNAKPGR